MADVLTRQQRSYCMSQIKGRDTKPEVSLRKALWSAGLRYRLNPELPGRPDLVFLRSRLAVFVDGCFWHACPVHSTRPATNAEFWRKKIKSNIRRDKKVNRRLEELGWSVIRVWEHEIEENLDDVVRRVSDRITRPLASIGAGPVPKTRSNWRVTKSRNALSRRSA